MISASPACRQTALLPFQVDPSSVLQEQGVPTSTQSAHCGSFKWMHVDVSSLQAEGVTCSGYQMFMAKHWDKQTRLECLNEMFPQMCSPGGSCPDLLAIPQQDSLMTLNTVPAAVHTH